jgi:putative SOS response-associated peptidase YedK
MRGFYCGSTSFFDSFELDISPRSLPLSMFDRSATSEVTWYSPGCFAPVLRLSFGKLELSLARWRISETRKRARLSKHGSSVAHHIKAESIFRSRNSPEVSAAGRCLIPAEGWYERVGKSARKGIWEIAPKNGGMIYFAGIWKGLGGPKASACAEFSIVTEPASESINSDMERAPVVLWGGDRSVWLDQRSTYRQLRDLFGPESPDIFDARLIRHDQGADNEKKDAPLRFSTAKTDRFAKLVERLLRTAEALEASGRVLEAACYRRDIEKLVARNPSLCLQ